MLQDLSLPAGCTLRQAQKSDDAFLEQLFRASRTHLLAANMPPGILEGLLHQQHQLQRTHYQAQWPEAQTWLLQASHQPIGKILINQTHNWLHIVDLALMPEWRGRGLGKTLLQSVQRLAEETQRGVRLSVDQQNEAAKQLYFSLGFQITGQSETHDTMHWPPCEQTG